MNDDDSVKTFWGICFVCGEQGHEKDRCPTRKENDKKVTAQLQRSNSAIAPSPGVSTGARLRALSSASSSVRKSPASRTRSAVAGKLAVLYRTISVETREKEVGGADQVQGRLDMCLEQIEMLRTELVDGAGRPTCGGRGYDDSRSKTVRRNPARGSERRRFDSVRGRRTNRYARGVDIEERSGG